MYQQTRVPKVPRRVERAGALWQAGSSGPLSAGLWNRLQEAALQGSEDVARLRHEFRRVDVLGHQLSGSGSGYFGVCRNANMRSVWPDGCGRDRLGRVFRVVSVNAVRQVRQYASLT